MTDSTPDSHKTGDVRRLTPTPNTSVGVQTEEIRPQIQRPARVLLGWLEEPIAVRFLSGQQLDHPSQEEFADRARRARQAIEARQAARPEPAFVSAAPDVLAEHVEALRQTKAGASMFEEGWTVALVDLRRVCAFQPHVFTDHAEDRAAPAESDNFPKLASVTLPLPSTVKLPAQFDEVRQSWIIAAPNPNLKIVGHFGGPVEEGVLGFGFAVTVLPSFLQVARLRDRDVLRDGYHRAYGLLRKGINVVPAFVREFGQFENLGVPPGMLSQAAYLGDRPPFLPDYIDDQAAASVNLPAFQKMIVINGLELTPIG